MKFTVEREPLLAALTAASKIAYARSPIPILEHARIRSDGKSLFIAAHSRDASIESEIKSEAEPGEFCIHASVATLVSRMPQGSVVQIETTEHKATIRCGKSKYTLPILPSDGFPDVLKSDGVATFTLTQEQLTDFFDRPSFCVSEIIGRPDLSGFLLHVRGNYLVSVGCNEKQLFSVYHPLPPEGTGTIPEKGGRNGVLIPVRAAQEILRLGGPVKISVSASIIEATKGGVTYASKLLDAVFPEYEAIIKPKPEKGIKVDRGDLRDCLQRMAVLAEREGGSSIVALSWDSGDLRLSLVGSKGEGDETIEGVNCGVIDAPVGIPINQFIGALDSLNGDTVSINLEDHTSQIQIRDDKEPNVIIIQMPARV